MVWDDVDYPGNTKFKDLPRGLRRALLAASLPLLINLGTAAVGAIFTWLGRPDLESIAKIIWHVSSGVMGCISVPAWAEGAAGSIWMVRLGYPMSARVESGVWKDFSNRLDKGKAPLVLDMTAIPAKEWAKVLDAWVTKKPSS